MKRQRKTERKPKARPPIVYPYRMPNFPLDFVFSCLIESMKVILTIQTKKQKKKRPQWSRTAAAVVVVIENVESVLNRIGVE